ncbi:MAG: HAD family hydrolase [Polyangiaceae bacterium]
MNERQVEPAELVAELDRRLLAERPSALAFDGDGTLWSGDVGEDLFRFAIRHGLLREAARAQIDHEANSRGFHAFADVNATAEHLFEAYLAHRFPEREMCELMTWCFAGHTPTEMTELAAEALRAAGHAERMHQELAPVLEFARSRGLRAIVVSASPRAIVELAASAWGFAPADIAASTPLVVSGVIAPQMAGALPYAAAKCVAGRALLGTAHWLGSFGDNVFDLEMLVEAEVAVAVRPKPALRARLTEVPGVLLLAAAD